MKPNYNRSIINIVSSIMASEGSKSIYPPLKELSPQELKKNPTICLIIIDGLAYYYLKKQKNSFLRKHIRAKLTSVFPSTTACAMTAIYTGVPPQQHGLTGWFMYFKELGAVALPLPYVYRSGPPLRIHPQFLYSVPGIYAKMRKKPISILPAKVVGSPYNWFHMRKAHVYSYRTMNEFIKRIAHTTKKPGKKIVTAYWPSVDSLSHDHGIGSKKVEKHFRELDEKLRKLITKSKDVVFIISADHGMIDLGKKENLWLDKFPKFAECFAQPLSMDPRVVACYINSDKEKQFKEEAKKLKRYFRLAKPETLIKQGYFGRGKVNPNLKDRLGDYILLMNKNYVLLDQMPGEKRHGYKGIHAGDSKEEMEVPLVVIKT